MIRVHVDLSVFTEEAAIGMVSGLIEVAVIPQVGDFIAFKLVGPFDAYSLESKLPLSAHLRVTDRIVVADEHSVVLLAFEDILAQTREAAVRLLKMFEQHHGLTADIWES